ncbi:serine hydrolase domain-containing protein [Pseudomonas sp. Marseille-QA0892]
MVQGYFDLKFEAVREAFETIFENPQERGAALCVEVEGERVVDLWGGVADKDGQQAWEQDTIVNVFSCTKPFAAVALLQLVQEGKLDLDEPVWSYWPEFASAGKDRITPRQLLSHTGGLAALREALPAEALYDWDRMTSAVAGESPWWAPGTAHGYSPITFGWLIGELLRRVDGKAPGDSIARRISAPLGLDFHVGLSDSEFNRVAHVSRAKGLAGDEATQRMLKTMMTEPNALSTRSFTNPPSVMTSTNRPEWRRLQQVAASGHGNARSLAAFYGALMEGELLNAEHLNEMTREHAKGEDLTLLTATRFGLGCMLDQQNVPNATYGAGPRAFGHPGAGGSTGFADPDHTLSFGFVTNTLGPYVLMDPRAQRLARAVSACL